MEITYIKHRIAFCGFMGHWETNNFSWVTSNNHDIRLKTVAVSDKLINQCIRRIFVLNKNKSTGLVLGKY